MNRILSASAVVLASTALVASTGSTAGAAPASEPTVQSSTVADEGTIAPRVNRWISIKAINKGRQAFVKGHVGPKNQYKRKLVVVQRKACKKCAWKFHRKSRTNAKSNYQTKVNLPRGGKHYFFRTRLPKSNVVSKPLEVWWT